jgi:hypothetical protein
MAKITKTALGFEREPLLAPFGFKGKSVSELWQPAAAIEGDSGAKGLGLGVFSVLWSDAKVFSKFSPSGGNAAMLQMTRYALELLKGRDLLDPIAMLDEIFEQVYRYGQKITGIENLRETFAQNALVPVDMALWRLWASENNIASFDAMMPPFARPALQSRQKLLALAPLVTYGLGAGAITELVKGGAFLLKIKLIDMGYGAIALKPIAKTLGMSLKILERAHKRNIPCFCADLTVNPLMAEWNKNLAARLGAPPGIKTGILEQNGPQYYANWEKMKGYHPMGESSWANAQNGFYVLCDDFYAHSGGIFENAPHYENLRHIAAQTSQIKEEK